MEDMPIPNSSSITLLSNDLSLSDSVGILFFYPAGNAKSGAKAPKHSRLIGPLSREVFRKPFPDCQPWPKRSESS